MFQIITGKINALKKICQVSDFKTRRMIATGLVMSSLTYIVQAYGSCSEYLINLLQTQQNIAARKVTKLPWYTATSTLLKQCGWLSVRQLIKYHSLTLIFKIVNENKPAYLYSKIDTPTRETRHSSAKTLRDRRQFKTNTAFKSFLPRSIRDWNSLPKEILDIEDNDIFKIKLRHYIIEKTPIK